VASTWAAEAHEHPQGRRVTLGVQVQQVEPPIALLGAWAGRTAVLLVVGIAPDSVALRAGVLVGDMILDVAGEPVESPDALRATLATREEAKRTRLYLLRGGQPLAVDVSFG
jgi:S1-C subfamily serine protease